MTFTEVEAIAFSALEGADAALADEVVEKYADLHDFFTQEGAGFKNLGEAMAMAREEVEFTGKHHVQPISIFDEDKYPRRLRNCPDAPLMLYKLGSADLNPARSMSVVGTRKLTPYGAHYSARLVEEVKGVCPAGVTVLSGLAYGVDRVAHEAALKWGMPTIGVLAHGLSMIYPATHRGLATAILNAGGALVTEYRHGEKPFRGNFLARNRLVAGMSDVVVVTESPVKGGAMNTARHAYGYGRGVAAVPGRIGDEASGGCNQLIARGVAHLVSSGKEIAEIAEWEMGEAEGQHFRGSTPENGGQGTQPSLFSDGKEATIQYEGATLQVYECLKGSGEPMRQDEIAARTGLPIREVISAVGDLDFDGILLRYPGSKVGLA